MKVSAVKAKYYESYHSVRVKVDDGRIATNIKAVYGGFQLSSSIKDDVTGKEVKEIHAVIGDALMPILGPDRVMPKGFQDLGELMQHITALGNQSNGYPEFIAKLKNLR